MLPIYEFTIAYVSQKLHYPMELVVGSSYDVVYDADFSFLCGLPYVLRTAPRRIPSAMTAIAAPCCKVTVIRTDPSTAPM